MINNVYDFTIYSTLGDIALNEDLINELETKIGAKIDYYAKRILSIYDDLDFVENDSKIFRIYKLVDVMELVNEYKPYIPLIKINTSQNIIAYDYGNMRYVVLNSDRNVLFENKKLFDVLAYDNQFLGEFNNYILLLGNKYNDRTSKWLNENRYKIVDVIESIGTIEMDYDNGNIINTNLKLGKYSPNFHFGFYDPKLKKQYVNNLKVILEKGNELIDYVYKETLDLCNEWGETDDLGNQITYDYIKEKFNISSVDIGSEFTTVWGMLPNLMEGHNINIVYNHVNDKYDVTLEG